MYCTYIMYINQTQPDLLTCWYSVHGMYWPRPGPVIISADTRGIFEFEKKKKGHLIPPKTETMSKTTNLSQGRAKVKGTLILPSASRQAGLGTSRLCPGPQLCRWVRKQRGSRGQLGVK